MIETSELNPLIETKFKFIRLGDFTSHFTDITGDDIVLESDGNYFPYSTDYDDCKIIGFAMDWYKKSVIVIIDVNQKRKRFTIDDISDEVAINELKNKMRSGHYNPFEITDSWINFVKRDFVWQANYVISSSLIDLFAETGHNVWIRHDDYEDILTYGFSPKHRKMDLLYESIDFVWDKQRIVIIDDVMNDFYFSY